MYFNLFQLRFAVDSEAASESLPIAEALRMLRMSTADELRDWAQSRDREWDVDVKSGIVRLRAEHKTDIEVRALSIVHVVLPWDPAVIFALHPILITLEDREVSQDGLLCRCRVKN